MSNFDDFQKVGPEIIRGAEGGKEDDVTQYSLPGDSLDSNEESEEDIPLSQNIRSNYEETLANQDSNPDHKVIEKNQHTNEEVDNQIEETLYLKNTSTNE